MSLSTRDMDILRAYKVGGAMTYIELAAQLLLPIDEAQSMKYATQGLYERGYLYAERGHGRSPSIYTLAPKARTLLATDKEGKGNFPAPREAVKWEPLVIKPTYTRETGNEAIPSLRGEKRIAYALPMSLAGGAR